MEEVRKPKTLQNSTKKRSIGFLHRIITLVIADGLAITFAYAGAFLLRYPIDSWRDLLSLAYPYIPGYILEFLIIGLAMFALTGMYRTLWRYASIDAVFVIGISTILAVFLPALVLLIIHSFIPNWSVFIIQWMLLFLIVSLGRFSLRLVHALNVRNYNGRRRILIYGAGDAGEMICRDLQRNRAHNYALIGFLDDDETKHHKAIHKIPILGGKEQVVKIVSKQDIQEIIIAMPSLPGKETRKLLDFLKDNLNDRVLLKTVPGLNELMDGIVTLQQIRQFRIRDLLRRKPVELNTIPVDKLIRGKTVLVSGGGGSIGSEICRQAGLFSPDRLIILDISEVSLYSIMEELGNKFGDIKLVPIIGDICNREFIERVFNEYHPDIVFHAAAYKHVPLMEYNPWSAVVNNVYGTQVLCDVSAHNQVERFVMISTDKAVRPSSIMGATKRICEMIVQLQDHDPQSVFSVVRFGNVMGSSGSVIPKFGRQIKAGGPVTITDRNTTRYFMLTSEAVQLVMQAATLIQNNAIYILDMGDPIKIKDLAYDMIILSGLQPNVDIEIKYTGLRPGEKLHEELCHTGNGKLTNIDKITVTEAKIPKPNEFLMEVDSLIQNCYKLSRTELYLTLADIVPDYSGADELQKEENLKLHSRRDRSVSLKTA